MAVFDFHACPGSQAADEGDWLGMRRCDEKYGIMSAMEKYFNIAEPLEESLYNRDEVLNCKTIHVVGL